MIPFFSNILSRLLIDRRKGHRRRVIATYRRMLQTSSMSGDEVRCYQDERLADLLRHAAGTVPFWREHIRATITPANARQILASLPRMTRSAIQARRSDFLSDSAGPVVEDATGGSTGTPMKFWVDTPTQVAREASLYWANHLAGWRYGQRVAMLWGSDRDVGKVRQNPRVALRCQIENMRWFNAFDMGKDRMIAFHRDLIRFRPHIIVAYAGSLDLYARFLKESQLVPAYPLTSLVSSAEVLTDAMRGNIESVFGKPVFNRYGNRETGAIAAEDGRGGLLVCEREFLVEIDSPDPVRIPGPIMITYLANRAMPFIRYDTGDAGTWVAPGAGDEACRRIGRIQGRQGDTIRTKGEKLIHGEYFTHLMYRARGVREFQFVQESLTQYQLLLVADHPEDEQIIAGIRADILEEVGADVALDVKYVESIPVLASGKRKFTLSRLQDETNQKS